MTAPTTPDRGITAGVGRTALLVAAARAIENHRPDAVARDPYAEHFVRADPGCADWPLHPAQVSPADPLWGRLAAYFALRTRVLDDHLLASARSGLRQVVLLGAGLDTRAHRLPWPPGTTVWELDRPEVLAHKQRVLDALGAEPAADRRTVAADRHTVAVDRRTVAVDLHDDWPRALTTAGLDPAEPVAWLAEGLLLYLAAVAERRLIATLDGFSAPGSTLAYEAKLGLENTAVRASATYAAARERIGLDLLALFAAGPRPDTAADLAGRGWHTRVHTPFDHALSHPRALRREQDDCLAANRWVFATKLPPT
ncbi:SAM-dependent methyltransferase [Kitasatospora sp. NPDC059599]|uniref:SAM-dependent methyltransferase n=1 Tax=Kitasatospora sp. NPDC059599 TaxID=3346880 RepID=UPI00369ADC6F